MSILIVRRGIQGPRGLSGLAARETLTVAANMDAIIAVANNIDVIAAAPIDAAHITYDHSTSGLTANSAQHALDELASNMATLSPRRVGEVISGVWATAPEGCLALNGQTGLSRTTYSKLFAHLNSLGLIVTEATKTTTQFGNGDGTTTFSMADWRDLFFRSVGGVRGLGSLQADALKLHAHTVTDTHTHGAPTGTLGYLTTQTGSNNAQYSAGTPNHREVSVSNTGPATAGITVNGTGDTETRPVNIALMYCITTGEHPDYYEPSGDPVYSSTTITADYEVGAYVNTVFVDAAAALEVTLPITPSAYREVWVKDIAGNAGTNNITVVGDIDGESDYKIGTNYGGATFKWNGVEWSIKA